MCARSVFLVDENGVIRHAHTYAPGTIPESKDLLDRLKAM
jgi:alkyl hydroperoxide reductase subunit AhpC